MKRRRVGGEEQRLFSRYWRHAARWRPGQRARTRRRVHKRERREGQILEIWIGSCCVCGCAHDHDPDPTLIHGVHCVMCRWCVCSEHVRRVSGQPGRQGAE